MKMFMAELRKEKRTGVISVLLAVGILGALYEVANFAVRKNTLLNLPLPPMDVLLTQLYGMIVVLNMFGIVVAACMIYNMEFKGNAVKKMYMLPINVSGMYLCKFLIISAIFFAAVVVQNLVLAQIGMAYLQQGAFEMGTLLKFAGYSYITSMPVLSFMVLVSSRSENMGDWRSRFFERHGFDKCKSSSVADPSLYRYAEACDCHECKTGYDSCNNCRGGRSVFPRHGVVDGKESAL